MRMRIRSAAVAAGVLTATVPLVTGLPASHAASPVYTITGITRATTLGLRADPSACTFKEENDLTFFVTSKVQDPSATGQVTVTGLSLKVLRNGHTLGTMPVYDAALEPGGNAHANYLSVSCRDWKPLMSHGFGGPGSGYHLKVVGPGKAHDINRDRYAGTVTAPATKFAVTVPQLTKLATPTGAKAGTDVVVSTTFKRWAKNAKGDYAWLPLAKHPVSLQRSGATSWSKIAGTTTTSTGRADLRFHPKKDNFVRFHLDRSAYTYGWQVVYYVDAKGNVSLAGR